MWIHATVSEPVSALTTHSTGNVPVHTPPSVKPPKKTIARVLWRMAKDVYDAVPFGAVAFLIGLFPAIYILINLVNPDGSIPSKIDYFGVGIVLLITNGVLALVAEGINLLRAPLRKWYDDAKERS